MKSAACSAIVNDLCYCSVCELEICSQILAHKKIFGQYHRIELVPELLTLHLHDRDAKTCCGWIIRLELPFGGVEVIAGCKESGILP